MYINVNYLHVQATSAPSNLVLKKPGRHWQMVVLN